LTIETDEDDNAIVFNPAKTATTKHKVSGLSGKLSNFVETSIIETQH